MLDGQYMRKIIPLILFVSIILLINVSEPSEADESVFSIEITDSDGEATSKPLFKNYLCFNTVSNADGMLYILNSGTTIPTDDDYCI